MSYDLLTQGLTCQQDPALSLLTQGLLCRTIVFLPAVDSICRTYQVPYELRTFSIAENRVFQISAEDRVRAIPIDDRAALIQKELRTFVIPCCKT